MNVKFKSLYAIVIMLLAICLITAACSTQQIEEPKEPQLTETISAENKETPIPTEEPTLEPLPEIDDLSIEWDSDTGAVLTWNAFECAFDCFIEQKEVKEENFEKLSDVDTAQGTYTDMGLSEGDEHTYRIGIVDNDRSVYSNEVTITVPFEFGSTGGNLSNGGISCEQNGLVCRLYVNDGTAGIYAESEGQTRLIVEDIASQLNISGDYLYYLSDVGNRNRSGLLYRVSIDGSQQPEQLFDDRIVFVLTTKSKIYVTLENSGALVVMNLDGTQPETLVEKDCYDLGGYEQILYYTNTDQKVFCMMDLISGEISTIPLSERGFAQIFENRVIYQNESDGKKLYSCALDGSDQKVLLDAEVTGINVNEAGVYCVNEDDGNKPYLIAFDGSDSHKLADVSADYIAVSGGDVIFYDAKGRFYIMNDAGEVTALTP